MRVLAALCAVFVLLASLISSVYPLPPDFFRAGRGGDLPAEKKSAAEFELMAAGCNFCGNYSPQFEFECRQNMADRRRKCMLAYMGEVDNLLSKRGWK